MKEKKVALIYVGRRISGDTVSQLFTHGKRQCFYNGVKYVIIGHKYFATPDGKHLRISRNPKDEGQVEFNETILGQWEMEDQLADQFAKQKRAAAKVKNKDRVIWPHVEPLHKIYRSLKSFEELRAFERYVVRLICQGKKK